MAPSKNKKGRKGGLSSPRAPVSKAVSEQPALPTILRDLDAARKLFEAILDTPNGKRSLSRLARTCRAMAEPALNILWRDLDSIVPILGLFPNHVLKKGKRPGLGFSAIPEESDWETVQKYTERIRRITYDENANNVAPSVFPILDEHRPALYILPHLQEVYWKAETAAGLDRCSMFLTPELQTVQLELGANFKQQQVAAFLADMSSRSLLTSFSFNSPTSLPDSFTELLIRQEALEKVVLVAPGALSAGVGRWVACLPNLKSLTLDLTGRSPIAVEGFFDEIHPRSGCSTPSSICSTDSGIFSGEELDFGELRKSVMRITNHIPSRDAFGNLRRVQLTGEVGNVAVFLKHLSSPVAHLDLAIDDPPHEVDWQDLSILVSETFCDTLQSLKISANGASRYAEATRSASPVSRRLSLKSFTDLTNLTRFEIDLPESFLFLPEDLEALALAAPRLEVLRLCPLGRFAPGSSGPQITLQDLALLTKQCKHLHTIGAVVNALEGAPEIMESPSFASRSLVRLHMGHSWVGEPLQVSILLSHLAPQLENLRWFQEKNRPGFVEANAKGWQTVSEMLPHIQRLRQLERSLAKVVYVKPIKTASVGINATPMMFSRGVTAAGPRMSSAGIQCKPQVVNQSVDAVKASVSTSVDARPSTCEMAIEAKPAMVSTEIDARPPTCEMAIDATPPKVVIDDQEKNQKIMSSKILQQLYLIPSVLGFFSFIYKYLITYPLAIPSRVGLQLLTKTKYQFKRSTPIIVENMTMSVPSSPVNEQGIPLDTIPEHYATYAYANYAYDYANAIPFSLYQTFQEHEKIRRAESETMWLWKVQITNNNTLTRHRERELIEQSTLSPTLPDYIMSDNKKQEKDFTKEVDELFPEAETLAKSGKLQEALDKILAQEKLTRNAADLASTSRLCKAAIQHCYDARDYPLLNSTILLLSKKHGQLKAAIQSFVELAITWLPDIKSRDGVEKWLEVLETLRTVTEGKIFLETPRARVTLLLSKHHEEQVSSGLSKDPKESLQTASDILSELQVETYSSMERREKTEFILEQMRLLIKLARSKDADMGKKDSKDAMGGGEAEWVKVRVGGRKVNEEFLKNKENEDLKLKYYDMMIQYALQHDSYLDAAKHYYKVWETPSIKEDVADKGRAALEHIVYYIVLAPYNNEQSDMLQHLYIDPALIKLDMQYNLVKSFATEELMRWPQIEGLYGKFLRPTPVFSAEKRWEHLHTRVIEHNVRVVSKYYTRITLERLANLLDLSQNEAEAVLSRLVVGGTIWAKIDRPAGIVDFRKPRGTEEVMNDWSSDMQKLLSLVEKTWMGMNAAQAAQSRITAKAAS